MTFNIRADNVNINFYKSTVEKSVPNLQKEAQNKPGCVLNESPIKSRYASISEGSTDGVEETLYLMVDYVRDGRRRDYKARSQENGTQLQGNKGRSQEKSQEKNLEIPILENVHSDLWLNISKYLTDAEDLNAFAKIRNKAVRSGVIQNVKELKKAVEKPEDLNFVLDHFGGIETLELQGDLFCHDDLTHLPKKLKKLSWSLKDGRIGLNTLKTLAAMPQLSCIELQGGVVTDEGVGILLNSASLKSIHIDRNYSIGRSHLEKDQWPANKNITRLQLSNTLMGRSATHFEAISEMSAIEFLNFNNCEIGLMSTNYIYCKKPEGVSHGDYHKEKILKGFGSLEKLKNLIELDISCNAISHDFSFELAKFESLVFLDLSGKKGCSNSNEMGSEGLAVLSGSLGNLNFLGLGNNKIGVGIEGLGNLKELVHLDLSENNSIHPESLSYVLRNLKKLKFLDISGNEKIFADTVFFNNLASYLPGLIVGVKRADLSEERLESILKNGNIIFADMEKGSLIEADSKPENM